jgi:hypothetical protein
MGDETTELERLRVRAYGRDADIGMDPAALERLRFLEGRNALTPVDPVDVARDDAVIDGVPTDLQGEGAVHPEPPAQTASETFDDGAATGAAASAASAPRPRRRAVEMSIVAVAGVVVGALAVHFLAPAQDVSTVTGAVLADTVRVDPSLEWPAIFGPVEDEQRSWSYRGLTMMVTPMFSRGSSSSSDDCFVVVDSAALAPYVGEDADDGGTGFSLDGMLLSACAAGAFPATVQFVVDDDSPTALRGRFSEGTSLQMVMEGDLLRVFEHAD